MSAAGRGLRGPHTLVFSDVDETLITCKSLFDFLVYYRQQRYGPTATAGATALRAELAARAAAGEPRELLNRAYFRAWQGELVSEVTAWGRRWFAERAREGGFFRTETLAALRCHLADGAAVVLVSGSLSAVLEPIAEAIGAAEVVCARPAAHGGRFTGELLGPPMIGTAKREAVRAVLDRYPQVAVADCYGYGDHVTDLPMLTEVGHPVVVGGSPELLRLLPRRCRVSRLLCPEHERELVAGQLPGMVLYG
ncbi:MULTISPECIES: HAD family hydrolase [Streptomyces]|uniref:HAD family hydrolase n=1 Tax=Streptomyces TaxID=1883 RepID=UPI00224F4F77|nr:HAD-IB family hydrolase [Streptomyces sp. NBC_01549]MCX4593253.1 HAD-IB family hydrolase [Streptomyces sp. NBC_01549]